MTTFRQLLTRTRVSEILKCARSNPGRWGQFRAFGAEDEASRPEASDPGPVEDVEANFPDSVIEDVEADGSNAGLVTSEAPAPGALDAQDLKPSGAGEGQADVSPVKRRDEEYFGGLFKATLLGRVVQGPVQKVLKSGRAITIFSVGTGGMRNNRRPFEGESGEEFAERSSVQWHRVAVYNEGLAAAAMRSVKAGSQVFVEGNLETRVFNDPSSGLVKYIKEVAVRQTGKVLFMDQLELKPKSPRAYQNNAAAANRS